MRRPIFLILFGLAGGIIVEYYIRISLPLFLVLVTAAIFILIVYCKEKKSQHYFFLLLCVSFCVGISGLYLAGIDNSILAEHTGLRAEIQGKVLSISKNDEDYYKAIVKIDKGEKIILTIVGTVENYIDLSGRTINFSGTVEKPTPRRNPKTFDYRLYLKTCGIDRIVKSNATDLIIIDGKINLLVNKLARLKFNLIERINKSIPPEKSGVLIGMLFGDKSYMDDDIYAAFQKNGIAHILSVSGIHVAIIYACISKVLGNRRRLEFTIITFVLLIFYAALAEFSPSVVRAVSMISLHLVSKLIFHRYDLACTTAACAIGMMLINPYELLNVGFQLSFLAVFTLSVALPWTMRRLDFMEESGFSTVLMATFKFLAPLIVIQIGMAPFTAYIFNYFSLGAFVLNIPIIFIAGLILPVGVLMILLSMALDVLSLGGAVGVCISGILNQIFNFSSFLQSSLINLMNKLNDFFYQPGISFFSVISPMEWIICFYYIMLFFLLSEGFRIAYQRKKIRIITKIILISVVISTIAPACFIEDNSDARLTFIDVGQGDSLHIRTPEGKNILIDGGGNLQYNVGEKTLQPYLLKNGVKEIDLAVVSHLHDDHYLGLAQLGQVMKIKKLALYESNIFKADEISKDTKILSNNLIYLYKGQILHVEEGVSIEILYPERKEKEIYRQMLQENKDENLSSLIVKINYQDISVLMTGDMGFDGEDQLVSMYGDEKTLASTILKVGHHGSKYSTSEGFVRAVNPRMAVFQVGKNNFGHPNQGVIEKFSNSGIMILRNDLQGAVMLCKSINFWEKFTDGNGRWHIKTMIK